MDTAADPIDQAVLKAVDQVQEDELGLDSTAEALETLHQALDHQTDLDTGCCLHLTNLFICCRTTITLLILPLSHVIGRALFS